MTGKDEALRGPDMSPEEASAASEDANVGVRISHYPVYSEVRHLLTVWPGRLRKQVIGLHSTLYEQRGTPQKTVDWTDPATWMPERLAGDDLDLAQAVWNQSKGVNPRFTRHHLQLAQVYDLLHVDGYGVLELTEAGRDFREHPGGETEAVVDEGEGLAKLLFMVAKHGPVWPKELVEEWGEYLARCGSPFRSEYTIRQTMSFRLKNLRERGMVERRGHTYSATPEGLAYLQKTGEDRQEYEYEQQEGLEPEPPQESRPVAPSPGELVRQEKDRVRKRLGELLHDMDPIAFEHLIKRLLEKMDYRNVEVTVASGDGGVDVVADIELGITSVREVVQVKRHRRAVQRSALDALRGSLYRFDAVRGTIVTTSRFAKGTQDAAFARGAAPITLIHGEKLIDLLIEHGVGVNKRKIELLEVDAETFTPRAKT